MSIQNVAAHIVALFPDGVSTMKLQKLAYLTQGWSMALRGTPLFNEVFEAWRSGPVSQSLFMHHAGEYTVNEWPHGDRWKLSEGDRLIVESVCQQYGALTGPQLSDLTTKSDSVWAERYVAGERNAIEMDDLSRYFESRLVTYTVLKL